MTDDALKMPTPEEYAKLEREIAAMKRFSTDDIEDQWTGAIEKAHPLEGGSDDLYEMALQMVGNRHSKYALVDLTNWLLSRIATLESQLADEQKAHESIASICFQSGAESADGTSIAAVKNLAAKLAEARKAFPFPEITAGNADAIAFHLEQQRETLLTPIATAIWLREVAKSIRALDQAVTPPNRKEN